jgi:hypothetical protein
MVLERIKQLGVRGMENATWFYRYGGQHEGQVHAANLKTGTATYYYEACCGRCGGAGGSDQWKFTGWTCYQCGGSGGRHTKAGKVYTAEKLAKLEANAKARSDKKIAAMRAKKAAHDAAIAPARAAWIVENQELYSAIHRRAGSENEFFESLLRSINERGCLSEKQLEVAKASVQRDIEREKKIETAQYVGNTGERLTITLTVKRMIRLDDGYSPYGPSYLLICEDSNGNTVTYKGGSPFASESETVTVKATVKGQTIYNDMPQTQIARPKIIQRKQ